MLSLAGFVCGFIFGLGLLISGMTQPTKVLNFLDLFGAWDPSLAVVMAAALAVSSVGFAVVKQRAPLLAPQNQWPTRTDIDRPLLAGSALFGVGWGLVGLCPGPALENLATLSPRVIVFVSAMAAGMVLHDFWQTQRPARAELATACTADG
jgi:uncharacterized membrane protein YedE/YeeE